jgi:penicillin-binding protein 2
VSHYTDRQKHVQILFLITALLLIRQAFYLQVIDSEFQRKANTTALDKITQYPARGLIYDRNEKLLIHNDPMYDLMVTNNQVPKDIDVEKFCRLLGIKDTAVFHENLKKDWTSGMYSRSVPFVFMSKISPERFAPFHESMYEFPGFFAVLRNARGYPHKNGAHLLGYIREVNRAEVEANRGIYASGDYIGASGLEASYEKDLRGRKGVRYVLKDNLGREVDAYKGGELDTVAISGKSIITSIDLDLQAYGEELMKNKIGGIVALDPSNGEILAMVSSPSYDPNKLIISNNERGASYINLVRDPRKPLLNRAVMAQYPPGSLFKTAVALIAQQVEVWPEKRGVSCPGGYAFGGKVLTKCHGHPYCSDITSAIQYSCNAYFVTVFREIVDIRGVYNPTIGLDTFNYYLHKMGLGRPLGIDFPSELKGNFPTSDYYAKNVYKNEKSWNSIWIRSLGIGQGELLMTNIQIANLAAIIANRGYYTIPHLIKGYRGSNELIPQEYQNKHSVEIDSVHFRPVVDGMERAVLAGTARLAQVPGISVCGKTGTAENPHGKDHSIFFCFAPKENPKIALAVYIENAGFGGTYAAPIAGLMIEKYLKGGISDSRKWLEKRMMDASFIEELP